MEVDKEIIQESAVVIRTAQTKHSADFYRWKTMSSIHVLCSHFPRENVPILFSHPEYEGLMFSCGGKGGRIVAQGLWEGVASKGL